MNDASRAQVNAARPDRSVWVSANAGSGKTRVLTERVARLLLADADPAKILCITFTKAAASEMQTRLFAMLGGWAMAEETRLRADLGRLTGRDDFGADELERARRLFAKALETPGGLKIQTIHAFCDSLLRRFPLEAGAPPGFSVIDEREQAELIARTLDEMVHDAATGGRAAMEAIAAVRNEGDVAGLAADVISRRALFSRRVAPDAFAAAFGVPHPPDGDSARLAAMKALDLSALRRMIAAWAAGTDKEQLTASEISAAATTGGATLLSRLTAALLTKTGSARANLATKKAQAAEPDHEALCAHLVNIVLAAREAELAADAAAASARLHEFGRRLVGGYEAAKVKAGVLDFDDLVRKASALLLRSDARAWVLYRLDGGIDHILVDEAQDTSRAQWDVVNEIAREFRGGEGARPGTRTSFVVGDEKQSIYRFQGAAPEMFDEMRGEFRAGLAPVGGLLEEQLEHSFRSAPAILQVVDATFAGDRAAGLSAAGAAPRHKAFFADKPGRVELWPLVGDDPEPDPPARWAPVDAPSPRSARLKLVEQVADRIAAMIGRERLPGGGRLVEPGDIIVLLQARAPMMEPLIRGLKSRGAPVAGADRLSLGEELAVKDLLALLRFAAAPFDDLSLAAALRSPLFGVTEDQLFDLAHDREADLWREVRRRAPPLVVERLTAIRSRADYDRPFELLQRALTEWGGRKAFAARLGPEAEDAIDELLATALTFEAREAPTIDGFLAHIDASDRQIKRQQDDRAGLVRVMSVHGAKGLEAPIVILPDTLRHPDASRGWDIASAPTADGPIPVAAGRKADDPALTAALRRREEEAEEHEHRRLLYVGMTRAEDWLIIAGAGAEKNLPGSWYEYARAGLRASGAREDDEGGLLLETGAAAPAGDDGADVAGAGSAGDEPVMPRFGPVSPPRRVQRRRPASGLAPADHQAASGGRAPDVAARYGEAVHLILEHGETDPGAARALIARFGLPPALGAEAVAEALRARAAPELARFFGEDAVAEAPVSAMIGGVRVSGRIDRMVVTGDQVDFVDFKSDAAPPGPDAVPRAYLAQLAAYSHALSLIYPERRIVAHLAWTAAPRVDAPDPKTLAEALAAAIAETEPS